jgi:hypothetical protein
LKQGDVNKKAYCLIVVLSAAVWVVTGCDAARDNTPLEPKAAADHPMDLNSATQLSLEPGATSLIPSAKQSS